MKTRAQAIKMSNLAPLYIPREEDRMQKFMMNVCNKLLIKIRMNGVDPSDAACFFGGQAQQMLDCPPNYGPGSRKVTTAKVHQLKQDVWLMRGFFPGTAQMFKISISKNPAFPHVEYYVKVSEPTIRVPTNKYKRGLAFTSRYETSFYSDQIRDQLQERLEKEVLGVDIPIDKIVDDRSVFTPKCLSPKGMKKFTLELKKG